MTLIRIDMSMCACLVQLYQWGHEQNSVLVGTCSRSPLSQRVSDVQKQVCVCVPLEQSLCHCSCLGLHTRKQIHLRRHNMENNACSCCNIYERRSISTPSICLIHMPSNRLIQVKIQTPTFAEVSLIQDVCMTLLLSPAHHINVTLYDIMTVHNYFIT